MPSEHSVAGRPSATVHPRRSRRETYSSKTRKPWSPPTATGAASRTFGIDQESPRMEDRQQAGRPTTVALTPVAAEALDAINLTLRDVGYRVKTAALVEAALVELNERMSDRDKAVDIVRRRVPPHSVVFPP
jgi:hypothetical protein